MITLNTDIIQIAFDQAKDARRRARKAAAKPPGTRKIEDKRRKKPKHRKPLRQED